MNSTWKTLEHAASISKFDIIELWYEDAFNSFECKFAYATEEVQTAFDSVIVGNYPHHSRDHIISPQLCQQANESSNRFVWLSRDKVLAVPGLLPIQTELAIFLKSRYLSGLTLCAYISAFFLDEEGIGNDLDEVHGKAMNFDHSIGGSNSILSDLSRFRQSTNGASERKVFQKSQSSPSHSDSTAELINKVEKSVLTVSQCYAAPTWEPIRAFSYPISQVPVLKVVEMIINGRFGELGRPMASGTNADVYHTTHHHMEVAVKVLKKKNTNSQTCLQELNMEHGMLARLSHENIVHILAAGESPQRFIALEFLGGGTLKRLLHGDGKVKSSTSMLSFSALFSKKKKPLPLEQVLPMARDMASAMDYMHERCWAEACFIHRDLKPENVGFTASMKLKLFDFGLMTCEKKLSTVFDMYELSGFTGSLRYMAPEVARKQPYNQKVDVYSFGITLWEMLTGKLPFEGIGREEFMAAVVKKNFRPPVPKKLPVILVNLLHACWDEAPLKRPSFERILATLEAVIVEVGPSSSPAKAIQQQERSPKGDGDRHANDYTNQKMASWYKK